MNQHRDGLNSSTALPFWRQLRWTLSISLILFAVVPLLIMETIILNRVDTHVQEQVARQLKSVAQLKIDKLELWLNNSQSILQLMLANPTTTVEMTALLTDVAQQPPATKQRLEESLNDLLRQKAESQVAFEEFFVYTPEGLIVISSKPDRVGNLVTAEPYFANSLATEAVQPPYYEVGRDELTMLVTVPLFDATTEQFLGVLAGRLNMDTLGDIMLERTGLGETGDTYLISAENNYLVTPSRFEAAGYPLNRAYHSRGIDQALQGEDGFGAYLDYRDPPVLVIGVYRWLPQLQVAMLAEVDEREALALFNQIRTLSLILTGLTVLVAAGFALYVATRVSRPIMALTHVATQISQGDLEQRVVVSESNEIGLLATAFNAMTRQLKSLIGSLEERVAARTQGLETVARLSEQLSAILSVNELAAAVVNQIQANFGYYHAHIYLLDEAGKLLVVAEGTGDAGATMKAKRHSIPLDAATSLVARAARSGEVVRVDNVREAPDWLPNELLPDTYAEMAVPIISEGRVVGVLDVQENRVGGLDEGDAGLLRSLANQVAVAIKNAGLYEELAQLNADKDTFFSIVAHDLKGPFQPLVGNAELLMEMADFFSPAEIKEMVGSMHRSSKQVLELLENLLQWSRIQMGRMEYQPEHVSLRRLVQETVDLLAVNAVAKKVSLVNEIQPQTIAYADSNMLNTVVRNLANNALKFTPQGGHIAVSATVQEATSMIEVAVTDTGVGISADDVAKLFRADVHHSTEGTANEKGTGLGLILCQEMVEANQGKIWAESELGQGTTIRFTVPLGQFEAVVELVDEADVDTVETEERFKSTASAVHAQPKLVQSFEIIKMSESVNRSAKAVYDLLDDLHSWVKTQMSWIAYEPTRFEVKPRLDKNLPTLSERAAQQQVTMNTEIPPALFVYADANIFDVLIQGLFLNALKFTPHHGTITLMAELHPADPVCILSISDTGRGMEKKEFAELTKGESLEKMLDVTNQTNVGLGLTVYRHLAEKAGGQMWSHSEPGQGTTISFSLPTTINTA